MVLCRPGSHTPRAKIHRPLETSAREPWNSPLSMRMAIGHIDQIDDLLLPILVTPSLPRPVVLICSQRHGHVHNPAFREPRLPNSGKRGHRKHWVPRSKISLVQVWNSLFRFRKKDPQGHYGHLFPARADFWPPVSLLTGAMTAEPWPQVWWGCGSALSSPAGYPPRTSSRADE